MLLTSTAFGPNGTIPERYTCDGEDESPPLTVVDAPAGTRSFAVIMHDPDSVHGDFAHWTLWNIGHDVREIKAGMVPDGAVEGMNDRDENGYTGPCPPPETGVHHYVFELLALDMMPDLPSSATRDDLLKACEGHELDRAELVGLFGRDGAGSVSS
ncbi:MAG: YbhB/YbcL family Raf kinase inhibitor-like protein [Candidatus Peribacteraceae bacterium]|nr:YbhB/YbcL family Raf kinase inhibitor-like protein [Candidatus Peribacteraceae bacterium]